MPGAPGDPIRCGANASAGARITPPSHGLWRGGYAPMLASTAKHVTDIAARAKHSPDRPATRA